MISRTLHRISTLFLLLLATSSLFAKQPLRVNICSEPPTIDPRKAYDVTSGFVILALYDGLTRIGLDGEPHLSIAKAVEQSSDGLTYTFHLREALWSNGDLVTARDFERTWKQVLSPTFPSQFAHQLFVIKGAREAKLGNIGPGEVGIHARDDRTLVVELEGPISYFLSLVASYPYFPVHESSGVTNGPFRLQKWRHDESIVVEKNPLYWDASAVRLPLIEMAMIGDERTSLLLFEREELDWIGTPICCLPYDAIAHLDIEQKAISGVYWYKLETSQFPLNHSKVRRALAYAIDREAIVRSITKGCQNPAHRLIPPPLSPRGEITFPDGDLARAKELLAEALDEWGVELADLPTITISYNQAEEHHRIAQVVQSEWQQLGLKVSLRANEWRTHLSDLTHHNYQVARQTWVAMVEDPIDILQLFERRNSPELGGNNDTSWEDERFIALLADGDLEAAEALFLEEMPAIPLFFCNANYLKRSKLKDICLSNLGRLDLKWAHL